MPARFVCEALTPVTGTSDTSAMAMGEPGLPREFLWRGLRLEVVSVLRSWRQTGPCRHGSGERYLRRHWYEVLTAGHGVARIYFDRQQRGGRKGPRWWLFSLEEPEPARSGPEKS